MLEGGTGYTNGQTLVLKRLYNPTGGFLTYGTETNLTKFATYTIVVKKKQTRSKYFHNFPASGAAVQTDLKLFTGLRIGMTIQNSSITGFAGSGLVQGDYLSDIFVKKNIDANNRVSYDLQLKFSQPSGAQRLLNNVTFTLDNPQETNFGTGITPATLTFINNPNAFYIETADVPADPITNNGSVLAWKDGSDPIQSSEVIAVEDFGLFVSGNYQVINNGVAGNLINILDSGFRLLITQTDISPKEKTPTIYSMPFVSVRVDAITNGTGGGVQGQQQSTILIKTSRHDVTIRSGSNCYLQNSRCTTAAPPLGIIQDGDTLVFPKGVLTSGKHNSDALADGTKVEFVINAAPTFNAGNTTFTGSFNPTTTNVDAHDILVLENTSITHSGEADGTTIKEVNRFILQLEAATGLYNATGTGAEKIAILLSANEGVVNPSGEEAINSGLNNNNIGDFTSSIAVIPSLNGGSLAQNSASTTLLVTAGTGASQYKFTNGLPYNVTDDFDLTHNAQAPAFYIGGELDGNNKTNLGDDATSLLTIIAHNLPTSDVGLVKGQLYNDAGTLKIKQ